MGLNRSSGSGPLAGPNVLEAVGRVGRVGRAGRVGRFRRLRRLGRLGRLGRLSRLGGTSSRPARRLGSRFEGPRSILVGLSGCS